jgi:soluble lytic murein transglycosylase-like protein
MSAINSLGVRVRRHLLFIMVFMACCVCVGAGEVAAQGVRISDADVNLAELALISHAVKEESVKMQGPLRLGVRPRGGRHSLVKLASNKRTPDQLMLEEAVYKEAARYSIDPDLVFVLVWQESGGRLNAVSPKNARGPLQLMPGTAARFGVRNPHDAKEAVRGGVAYLVWLLDKFGGNVSLALAGYNAGESSVDAYLHGKSVVLRDGRVINRRGIRTGGIPPYDETEDYVRRIAERYRMIRAARAGR